MSRDKMWCRRKKELLLVRNGERAGDGFGRYDHDGAVREAFALLGGDLLRVSDEGDFWVAYYRSDLPAAIAKGEK